MLLKHWLRINNLLNIFNIRIITSLYLSVFTLWYVWGLTWAASFHSNFEPTVAFAAAIFVWGNRRFGTFFQFVTCDENKIYNMKHFKDYIIFVSNTYCVDEMVWNEELWSHNVFEISWVNMFSIRLLWWCHRSHVWLAKIQIADSAYACQSDLHFSFTVRSSEQRTCEKTLALLLHDCNCVLPLKSK